LSNAVQNAINAGDNSVLGGIISACTLVAANYLVGLATFKSKAIEQIVEGRPEVLVHNGKVYEEVMMREQLTRHELHAARRAPGCCDVEEVHYAILERNGHISVVAKKDVAASAGANEVRGQ